MSHLNFTLIDFIFSSHIQPSPTISENNLIQKYISDLYLEIANNCLFGGLLFSAKLRKSKSLLPI